MWYYVPSISAPGTPEWNSPSDSPASMPEPWLTLSGTATQRPFSWPGWKRRTWIKLLSGLTSERSTVERGLASWISSLPASRVSCSPLPVNSVELTMTGGSGLPSGTSFVTWDRASCSWRTSPNLFDSGYLTSSPTLPTSGSMRSGVCAPQPTLAHLTSASGSGSWGTPVARDDQKSPEAHLAMKARMGGGRKEVTSLTVQIKQWATPRASMAFTADDSASSNPNAGGDGLVSQSKGWPTPTAHDAKGQGHDDTNLHNSAVAWPTPKAMDSMGGPHRMPQDGRPRGRGPTLKDAVLGPPEGATRRDGPITSLPADLNPRFVEALMGVPLGWLTPFTAVETDSFRRWLHAHSLSSPDELGSVA